MKLKDCMPIMWQIHWLFILESYFIHLVNIRGLRDRCPIEYTLEYNSDLWGMGIGFFTHIKCKKDLFFIREVRHFEPTTGGGLELL